MPSVSKRKPTRNTLKEQSRKFLQGGALDKKTKKKELRRTYLLSEKDTMIAKRRIRRFNIGYYIAMSICVLLVSVGVGIELWYIADTTRASKDLQAISHEYTSAAEVTVDDAPKDMTYLPPLVDFAGLKEANSDVSAWLKIPDTTVDYPVLTSSEKDKYLYQDFYGNYSISGSLFTDYQNTNDLSQSHTVIYGHHMNAPVMFHDVSYYTDYDFFMNHRLMYLVTPETTYVLSAVGSYIADGGEYMARQVLFGNENDFQSYLDERLARCDYVNEQDVERRVLDRLVTLVTCTNTGDSRVIVECVVTQAYPTEYIENVIANS